MNSWLIFVCIFNVFLFRGLNGVIITNIEVPSMVIMDDSEDDRRIMLNCDYELESGINSLVVKWFKDDEVIYQWIRGQPPSVIPKSPYKIDNDYKASMNTDKMYSSVVLVDPDIESSGYYKCLVQTNKGTDNKTKRLQIIEVSNHTLELHHTRAENETHLECEVQNVYPEPTLILTVDDKAVYAKTLVQKQENGLYDAFINVTIATDDEDDMDDEDAYVCTVSFGYLPFNLTTSALSSAMSLLEQSHIVLIAPILLTTMLVVLHAVV